MNWPHIHLLLNHAPLFGTIVGTTFLAAAILRNHHLIRPALYVLVLSGIAAIVVYLTGEPAADALVSVPEGLVDRHEDMAGITIVATSLAGVMALIALIVDRRFPALTRWMNGAVLALALGASGLLAWTANLGGQIQHPEARGRAVAPGTNAPGVEEPGQR